MRLRTSRFKKIRQTLQVVFYDWQTMLGFEVMYKLISASIFLPLIKQALNGVMYVGGYEYLTIDNVRSFLASPMTMLFFLLLAILVAVYSMIDISAVIYIIDCSRKGIDTTAFAALRFGIRSAVRVLRPRNLALMLIVLLMVPLSNIGALSGFVITIRIPDFIQEYIRAHLMIFYLLLGVYLLVEILMVSWIYVFHYYCLEGCSFREARKRSVHNGRGIRGRLMDLGWIIGVQLVVFLAYVALALIGMVLIAGVRSLIRSFGYVPASTTALVYRFLSTAIRLMQAVSMPITYGMISTLFYADREQLGPVEQRDASPYREVYKRNRRRVLLETVLAVAAIAVFSWYSWRTVFAHYNVNVQYLHETEVTAHRGASKRQPENTMAAFVAAVEEGADWIELDVQQSADGEIFVMHDTNFKRTTGVDAVPWELSWSEIRKLDAGSWFSEEYAGETIPLLSEVIDFAKLTGMRLNIELKPTGHEKDFEESVVRIVEEAGFESNCVITSQSYPVLMRVKEINPDIRTVYVMSIAYGRIDKLEAADDYSIEETFATSAMVRRIHNSGHQVLVWTVNSKKNIRSAINSGADNIITDNVPLANQCVDESMTAGGIKILLNQIRDIFTL